MKLIDIETDGFLEKLTQIYCAVMYDTETQEYTRYNAQNNGQRSIEDFLEDTSSGDLLAHYGLGFDYLAIKKLYPDWKPTGRLYDSVLISQLIWTNLKEIDFAKITKIRYKDFPRKLIGSHSLKAWGERLGDFKDDFNPRNYIRVPAVYETIEEVIKGVTYTEEVVVVKAIYHTWETIGWNQDMEDYCIQDVRVTKLLWELIQSKNYSQQALELEHDFAQIIKRQEMFGFKFDEDKAQKLLHVLLSKKCELSDKLQETFKPWERIIDPNFVPKVNNKARGYVKGVPFVKKKTITFNAGSRDHIAERLKALYGWQPTLFGKDGKPSVDETILKSLSYPPIPLLLEYLLIDKRLGLLAEGKQAWLKKVVNGRLHGRVNTAGAVTGRCTHNSPNIAATPSSTATYGAECRDLFTVDAGYKLVGADASGLELRCLAHYMAAYDNGAYVDVILNGDIHTVNQKAAGLPTRNNAKTFIYGFLYGAGAAKLGEIVGGSSKEGNRLKAKFLESLPALDKLTKAVKRKAVATKTLRGLDGRVLHVRSPHAALNTLLQSAGALIMKQALIELDKVLQLEGLTNSSQSSTPDYEFVGNIHDEFQIQVKDEYVELVCSLSEKALNLAGLHFNFKSPIDGESKSGMSWRYTH